MIRKFSNLVIVAAAALSMGAVAANAQWRGDRDHDNDDRGWRGDNRSYDQRAYRQGLEHGREDRSRNRHYNYRTHDWNRGDSSYRGAYQRGYDQGYNQGYANGAYGNDYPYGRYPHNYPYGGYPSNYPYGNYPYPQGRRGGYGGYGGYGNPGNIGYSQGLQDGRYDGQHDRDTGHSYRPTEDSNYKHADRGYSSSFGDKNMYKQDYRSGYLAGYQQGYGQGYGRRRY